MICGARGEQVRAGLTHEQPITDYTQISIIHMTVGLCSNQIIIVYKSYRKSELIYQLLL